MEVKLSGGHTAEIQLLTTRERSAVAKITGSQIGDDVNAASIVLISGQVASICAVRKLDGDVVTPLAGGAAYARVENALSRSGDFNRVSSAYNELEKADEEEIKNELSANTEM